MNYTIKPIGIVNNSVNKPVDTNWGEVESEINIYPEFRDGLKGLEEFSHIQILFFMHKASFHKEEDLIRHPRGRKDLPLLGIFAQRAKHRPNPIGITIVHLIKVKQDSIFVKGLDAIDKTPVIDIKPYIPIFDQKEKVIVPDWIKEIMSNYF